MNRVPVNRVPDPEIGGESKYGIFPRAKEERLEKTLTQLLSKISRTTGETKVNYLHTLWNMITPNNDLMKTFICLPHFQVLPFLSTLLTDELDINILHPIIGCLWYLSRNEPISLEICSKEIPLLSNIMRILSLFPVFKEDILKIIGNCALVKETHSHLLQNDYHLLEYLKNNILNGNHNNHNNQNDNNDNNELSYQVLTCLTSSLTIQECDNMIQYNLPSLIFQQFFLLLEIQSYSTLNSNIVYWCLNYLTLLSYSSNRRGIQHLLSSMNNNSNKRFMIRFLIKFLDQENMTSLKAAIIIASIFGKHSLQYEETYYDTQQQDDEIRSEENGEHVKQEIEQETKQKSFMFGLFSSPHKNNKHSKPSFRPQTFLQQYPYLYPLLLQVYDITLNYNERESLYIQLSKKGFGYGVVKLRNITDTLRNLAYYDDNQRIMILMKEKGDKKDRINEESFDVLFSLLLQTIVLYVNNSSECSGMGSGTGAGIKEYGGGGGNDIDTIENVLELLIQLSIGSYYEILYHYISNNSNNHKYHLITLLNQLIHLPERRLTIEMKEYSQLLYHLYTR